MSEDQIMWFGIGFISALILMAVMIGTFASIRLRVTPPYVIPEPIPHPMNERGRE